LPNKRILCRKSRIILLSLSLIFISISFSWAHVSADDTTPPSIEDIKIKPKNRIELGETPFIEVKVEDESGINQVLIEFEGANHTMENKATGKWSYDSWIPKAVGEYIFTIHAEDNEDNWASASETLYVVEDATPPEVNFIETPVEKVSIGDVIVFSVFVNDTYDINQVLFEF